MKNAILKFFGGGQTLQIPNIKEISAGIFRVSLFAFNFSLLFFALGSNVPAQDEDVLAAAPPPLKAVSKAEKSALDAETDVSDRTKLSLALMESRLKKAEDLHAKESYREMFDELGGFHALIDGALDFLNKNDTGRGKVLNSFKRVEINLRQFIPRIELIRRELSAKYEPYLRNLIKSLRAARSRAVEPLFGDSVVPSERGN